MKEKKDDLEVRKEKKDKGGYKGHRSDQGFNG